jgi:DNA-binding CsgD family transcriptional regulator
MDIDEIVSRIPSLSSALFKVLASMSDGMSNGQIAEKLGYKNVRIVSTYISLINRQLNLTSINSRIEKRQIAIEAFKKSRNSAVTVEIFPSGEVIKPILEQSGIVSADKVKSLLTTGYELDSIEMVFRRSRSRHQEDK